MGRLLSKISIVWCLEDVLGTADEMGVTITKKEASEVLWLLKNKHDAEVGVSWDTIKFWINDVIAERKVS